MNDYEMKEMNFKNKIEELKKEIMQTKTIIDDKNSKIEQLKGEIEQIK